MANYKQTCLSATERVYHTNRLPSHVIIERWRETMNSRVFFSKENKVKRSNSESLDAKIKVILLKKKKQ